MPKSKTGLRLRAIAVDTAVAIVVITILLYAATHAIAQPGVDSNGYCSVDSITGETVCQSTNGGTFRYATTGQGTGAPSTYRPGTANVKFVCNDGGGGDRRSPFADPAWRKWAQETVDRVKALEERKQDRGDYLTSGALDGYAKRNEIPVPPKDQATTTYVEDRLKALGGTVDQRLQKVHDDAAVLAAKALAAAKDDAAQLVPGILASARNDASSLAISIKNDVDARLQNVSVTGVAETAVGFGLKHLLLAAGVGGAGVIPVWLLAKLFGFGFNKAFRRGSGGPRDGGFPAAGRY